MIAEHLRTEWPAVKEIPFAQAQKYENLLEESHERIGGRCH